jgi:hypothetical protein
MAYTHSKYEVAMAPVQAISASGAATTVDGALIDATGVAARWRPGYVPHVIRGAAVMSSATVQHNAAISIGFEADITTLGTPTRVFTIVLPTTAGQHKSIFYTPTFDIELAPGMLMTANVTAAATAAVRAQITLYVEPRWEVPGNVTSMLSTT